MIQHSCLGEIMFKGERFCSDVIIVEGKAEVWIRDEVGYIKEKDILKVIEEKPDIFIVGTGYESLVEFPESGIAELEDQGIEVFVGTTDEAVDKFNSLNEKKVIAGFCVLQ